jgi:hypothetical protein
MAIISPRSIQSLSWSNATSADRGFKSNAGHLTRDRKWDGTFAEIATDLAFDDTRVPALASCGQDEEREIVEERVDAAGQRTRWREPRGVPEGAQGEERVAIAQAQGRHAGPRGCAAHDDPDEVVGEQQPPDLLFDTSRRLAAQGLGALEGVRLELVEGEFEKIGR